MFVEQNSAIPVQLIFNPLKPKVITIIILGMTALCGP
jgi:hypothetical protein